MQFKTLVLSSLLAAAASATEVTGKLGDAAVVNDNPVGKTYVAKFPSNGTVSGSFEFAAASNGTGVVVHMNLEGFLHEIGPFTYHIHDQPVPTDGNCTGTKAHLDPYQRGQEPPCDKSDPKTCEVGDLSGKYGAISGPPNSTITYEKTYTDLYISTKEGLGSFIGNRSVVIHRPDKSRLICVNITEAGKGDKSPVNSLPATGAAVSFGTSSVLAIGSILAGIAMAL